MADGKDWNDVSGWLLTYVVLRYAAAASALLPLAAIYFLRPAFAPQIGRNATSTLLIASLIGIGIALVAATGVLRTSRWAISVVGLDLIYQLIFSLTTAYANGLHPPALLVRDLVQIAILLAWLEYFRRSRRVREALGKNLFHRQSVEQT